MRITKQHLQYSKNTKKHTQNILLECFCGFRGLLLELWDQKGQERHYKGRGLLRENTVCEIVCPVTLDPKLQPVLTLSRCLTRFFLNHLKLYPMKIEILVSEGSSCFCDYHSEMLGSKYFSFRYEQTSG